MFDLKTASSPFLHVKKDVVSMTWLKIMALLPVIFLAVYFFRFSAIERLTVVLVGAFLGEIFSRFLSAKKTNFLSGEALWEGLLLALLLPASLPLSICFTGGFLMILFFREFYGGPSQNITSPVLAALLFLIVSFPILIFDFTSPLDVASELHPYLQWKLDGTYVESLGQLFIGWQAGSMGTISILACLLGGSLLLIKKIMTWEMPFIYLGIYSLVNFLWGFPFELSLFGGNAFFLAVFILPMGSHVPHERRAKRFYCIIAAVLSSLIQRYSFYYDGNVFGMMIASCLTPWLNRLYRRKIEEGIPCASN
jgi:electron transport complex protein RnfD